MGVNIEPPRQEKERKEKKRKERKEKKRKEKKRKEKKRKEKKRKEKRWLQLVAPSLGFLLIFSLFLTTHNYYSSEKAPPRFLTILIKME
jgi:outer membrane biosynthesis protein TonB